jgi:putative phosphoesterase
LRIAVISDIHGNCYAFDVALADLEKQGVDTIVCLGDAIQGGAQPAETVARLRALGCPVVMGNADDWMLTGEDSGAEGPATPSMEEIRLWSLSRLSEGDKAFIRSFQPTVQIPLEAGQKLLCGHGSPHSFDDVILPETPEEEFRRLLGEFVPAIVTGGHTHLQFVRRLDDTFFFNPGSVGVAYNRHQPEDDFHNDPWAEYAILTVTREHSSLEFRRVPYSAEELIRTILSSGRPYAERAAAQYRSGK